MSMDDDLPSDSFGGLLTVNSRIIVSSLDVVGLVERKLKCGQFWLAGLVNILGRGRTINID